MGLRINTNAASLSALRNLRLSDRNLATSLERLSTGLRINRASDDPSGLVISEQLRAQTRSLSQALENTENGSNMIGTAEAALNEVSSLLLGVRESAIFALNTAGTSVEQVAAEQDSVNAALQAIERIATSTRFGSTKLLDGSSAFSGTTNPSTNVRDLDVHKIQMNGYASRAFVVNISTAATKGDIDSGRTSGQTIATGAGILTFEISGNKGSKIFTFNATSNARTFHDMINLFAQDTGVYASFDTADGNQMHIRSLDYGSSQKASIRTISATGTAAFMAAVLNQTDFGSDTVGTINNVAFTAKGRDVSFNTAALDVSFTAAAATFTTTFSVTANTGLRFQLQTEATVDDALLVGIRSVALGDLGKESQSVTLGTGTTTTFGGKLNTLNGGEANDLDTNAANALRIVDQAIEQVNGIRARLGAVQSNVLDSNTRSLGIALENLTASESAIRDLDFAAETAEFTKTQILFQASTAVLASANLIPQTILSLLQ